MNQPTNDVQALLLTIKLKPSIFVLGVAFGFIVGFILTGTPPEFSSQKDFSSMPFWTTQ